MSSNSEISLYIDTLFVQSVLTDDTIHKVAQAGGIVSALIEKVKGYVDNNIDPDNKTGSVLNILAPAAVSGIFSAFGFKWTGVLFGLATRVFHIDVAGILKSIYDEIKSAITGNKQVSSSQVDAIVQNSVKEHTPPPSDSTIEEVYNMIKGSSFDQTAKDIRFIKLAMLQYSMNKTAAPSGFKSLFSSKQAKTASVLARILGWFFKIVLGAAGFMIAGDAINHYLGRPNALDNTIQKGKPVAVSDQKPSAIPVHTTTQTKFKVKSSYKPENYNQTDNWIEKISNNETAIGNLIVSFVKDVYEGLEGKDSLIRNTAGFGAIVDRISWFNRDSVNGPVVFIPKEFHSKKQIADYIIDDVAEAS